MAGPNYQATAKTNNESDSRVKPLSYKTENLVSVRANGFAGAMISARHYIPRLKTSPPCQR